MLISLKRLRHVNAQKCFSIERFIQNTLKLNLSDQKILIALSGGADSTALLLILIALKNRLGISEIGAAHLNHLIRDEAKRDESFCKELCQKLGIDFVSQTTDVPKLSQDRSIGLEEAAREARYDFLLKEKEDKGYHWLAFGHQLEDLAEDQFMRILRGSGWPALGGMDAINLQNNTMRPLLLTSKKDLQNILKDFSIKHVEDHTNLEPFCLRNRIRLKVTPFFIEENPNYLERAANLWEMAQMDKISLEKIMPKIIKQEPGKIILREEKLQLTKSLRFRLYKASLDLLGSGQAVYENILKLDQLWKEKRTGSSIQFPGNKVAYIERSQIIFQKNK